jgi:translation elongation factor EF-4
MDIERERGITIKSQAACRVEPEAMTTQNRACFSISSFLDHIYNPSHQ